MEVGPHRINYMDLAIKTIMIRGTVKNYLADFSANGGGYPPIPLSFFGHNDFFVKGGGSTPQIR